MQNTGNEFKVQIDLNDRTKTGLVPVRTKDSPGLEKLLGQDIIVYEPDDGVKADAVVESSLGRFTFLRVDWSSLRDL